MTFLQSIFLFGLFAVIVPLLIHLFSLRKKERIPFSSLYFLKIIERKKIRRLKLKQIILLLLRMAVVGLLVMVFARPTLIGGVGSRYSETTPISAVIIVDNSLSTAAEFGGTSIFELIRQKSLQALESLKDGDEIFLLFSTNFNTTPDFRDSGKRNIGQTEMSAPREEEIKPVFEIAVVRRQIQSARISNRTNDLSYALQTGYDLLESSTNLFREIFLVSDFQATNFKSALTRTPFQQQSDSLSGEYATNPATRRDDTLPVQVFCIDPVQEKPENAGITGATIQNQIIELGKQIVLRVTIQKYSTGTASGREQLVNLYLDGKRVAQKNVVFSDERFESIDFQVIPERAGILEGLVEIEEDALTEDNRYYFVLAIPDTISVLIINGIGATTDFLRSVYTPESARQIAVHTISEKQISAVDFNDFDVVMYNGYSRMTQADVYRIRNFCAGGGGIVVFPGENSDLESFNESIVHAFSLPKATGFSGQFIDPTTPGNDYFTIGKLDFSHPVFVDMFQHEIPEPAMPRIFRSVDFEPPALRNTNTIIALSNDRPFLTETRVEEGSVVLFASAPSLSWNDFPLKGIFAPLMYRLVYYLALSGVIDRGGYETGDPIQMLYRGNAGNLNIVPPVGEEYKLAPSVSSESFFVEFSNTDDPGIYSLKSGNEVMRKFAVNIPLGESDLRSIPEERLKTVFGKSPFSMWSGSDNISERIKEARSGHEISRYAIIAVLVFLLLETIIQREKKGKEPAEKISV